jgi:hypothetical protein
MVLLPKLASACVVAARGFMECLLGLAWVDARILRTRKTNVPGYRSDGQQNCDGERSDSRAAQKGKGGTLLPGFGGRGLPPAFQRSCNGTCASWRGWMACTPCRTCSSSRPPAVRRRGDGLPIFPSQFVPLDTRDLAGILSRSVRRDVSAGSAHSALAAGRATRNFL